MALLLMPRKETLKDLFNKDCWRQTSLMSLLMWSLKVALSQEVFSIWFKSRKYLWNDNFLNWKVNGQWFRRFFKHWTKLKKKYRSSLTILYRSLSTDINEALSWHQQSLHHSRSMGLFVSHKEIKNTWRCIHIFIKVKKNMYIFLLEK